MTRLLTCLVLLGAIGAVAVPVDALAQPAPAVDKKQVAKQYVDAGLAAQDSGDYDTAITFYSKAYQLVQHPALIFNIAQAHRLAGRVEQALSLYKRYLAENPKGDLAATARQLIKEIETHKAEDARKADEARKSEETRKADEVRRAEEARKADEARKLDEARKADEARKLDDARKADEVRKADEARKADERKVAAAAPAAPPDTAAVARDASPAVEPGRSQRIAGLAVGAGGVVALAVGIGYGVHARSLSNQVSHTFDPAKVREGERANTIAITGMTGGAVLIAAGAALYWWGYTQGRAAEHVALAPMLSPQTAGVVLSGTLP